MTQARLLAIDLALKAALVALLAVGAFSSLEQFEGKAFGARLATYPLAALAVPLGWWLAGRPPPYPYALDMLLVSPFLVDVAGNALDLYDTVSWWDDANHFLNFGLFSLAVGQLAMRLGLAAPGIATVVVGAGAVAAILWELGEYVAFIRDSPELATAYTDTLGDMALGLGGAAAAVASATLLRRPRRR